MSTSAEFEIFLSATPGLEAALCAEAIARSFKTPKTVPGGVTIKGRWLDVWRANLELRGAGHVLARIATFPVIHLSQLDKRAHKVAWGSVLRRDVPFRVEASCKASKIYHSGAAAERIERAISDELGASSSPDAIVCVKARIEGNICTIAVDTSGESLHKRGFKEAVAKAPMRETMAAMFLRQCAYDGREPVLDPMCGSGTFVIEAAEIAAGLKPGRARRFAFEHLASFDPKAWAEMREPSGAAPTTLRLYGSDYDAGAVRMSRANAERAGVGDITDFRQCSVEELTAPVGPPGLVVVNPPYGDRIGDKRKLQALYRSLGATLLSRFPGWRVGLVTNEASLAQATGLPFVPASPPVLHGGLRIMLFQTRPLA
jgi:putative N6-adenine-specific DNA methylase